MPDGATVLPAHLCALLRAGAIAPGEAATLVQTHASYVLLAGDRVVKLKKPLDLGFLDYSTLGRRRAACEAEVRLNRRLTEGVYLGVEPVARVDGGYRLGPGDAIVDYAVVMRRLPAARMMDTLVDQDAVSADMLTALAHRLAAFHGSARTGGDVDDMAQPATLLVNWQENLLQTLPYVGRTIAGASYRRIAGAVYRDLIRLRPVWRRRVADGRARDGHGDLRLSAVCFEQAVQIYDCIEFSDRFRFGDVAAEVAFLAMDLDRRGRPDLADEFVAAYALAANDATLTTTLPFYRCYRAYVRGKVDSFLLEEPDVPAARKRSAHWAARGRFAQADWYARPPRIRAAIVAGADPAIRDAVALAVAGRVGGVRVPGAHESAVVPAVGGPGATRPVRIACGPDAAPAGAVDLTGHGDVRGALAELHRRLPLAPRRASPTRASAVRAVRE